jgi:YidC/Oxa1 family membrane protein insertase
VRRRAGADARARRALLRRARRGGGRFLWIGNIAKPDFLLTIAVTALTYAAVAVGAKDAEPNKTVMLLIPAVVTALVLSRLAAGIGLYWGVSSLVSLLQAVIVRRQSSAKAC